MKISEYLTLILAVLGWLIALMLQNRNIKQQHRIEIRFDIYKKLVEAHKETQGSIIMFGANSRPIFVQMSTSMIPFELKLDKEYKGQYIPWTEQECLFEGEKKWTSFVNKLDDLYSDFSGKILGMQYILEAWSAPLRPLISARDTLFGDIEKRKVNISQNLGILRMYTVNNGHDWRKWDVDNVEKITDAINEDSMTIGIYLHDFMVLVHNEFLSSYFKYERPIRKTLDKRYKVLTKEGIVERLDLKKIEEEETKELKKDILSNEDENKPKR